MTCMSAHIHTHHVMINFCGFVYRKQTVLVNGVSYTHTHSDVNKTQLDSFLVLEVWDWDRLTANDFVGGFALRRE